MKRANDCYVFCIVSFLPSSPIVTCRCCSSEMCSAENIMGSKLMISVKMPNKDEPLLKEDTPEPSKQTKGSSLKQVFISIIIIIIITIITFI